MYVLHTRGSLKHNKDHKEKKMGLTCLYDKMFYHSILKCQKRVRDGQFMMMMSRKKQQNLTHPSKHQSAHALTVQGLQQEQSWKFFFGSSNYP